MVFSNIRGGQEHGQPSNTWYTSLRLFHSINKYARDILSFVTIATTMTSNSLLYLRFTCYNSIVIFLL